VALATLEGRKLLRHPLFLAGVGFVAIGTAMFVRTSLDWPVIDWGDDGWMVGAGVSLLALLTMIAANLAALRDRREGTVEQHLTLPLGPTARTGGVLLGLLWPVFASAVLLAGVGLYASSTTELSALDLIHLVDAVALVLVLGALGVALARWLPNAFVAPVVAWGVILTSPAEADASWHALSPFASAASTDLAAWHLVYLLGLALCAASAALLKDRSGRGAITSAVLGLVAVGVTSVVLVTGACPDVGRCAI
jgi:hypothetical protein